MAHFGIDRFVELAGPVQTDDLDWDECRRIGLHEVEARVLRYMGDTETHTILYMRDLLAGHSARDYEITNFLSVWVYEELAHGRAIARLLEECGHPLPPDHYDRVTRSASWREILEAILAHGAALATPRFIAVHMTWGAINELTAASAYEALVRRTRNPVVAELLRRMIKQERKHFGFYFDQAKRRLEDDIRAQALTRFVIRRFWNLVGSDVIGQRNMAFVTAALFPRWEDRGHLRQNEAVVRTLPGMEHFDLIERQVVDLAASHVDRHGAVRWPESLRAVSSSGDRATA